MSDVRRPTRFMTESSIRKALPESFKDVSPGRRGGSSWLRFTPAYGFGWRRVGIRRNVGQGPVHLLGLSASPEHTDIIGGSTTEITPLAHVIMVVIAPWIKPFLAYLNRQELPEDQNEARCIVRHSKA